MEKYILGEIFSSGGATLYKNSSDQTVPSGAWAVEANGVRSVARLDINTKSQRGMTVAPIPTAGPLRANIRGLGYSMKEAT